LRARKSGGLGMRSKKSGIFQWQVESSDETVTKYHGLKIEAEDGKLREADAADRETP